MLPVTIICLHLVHLEGLHNGIYVFKLYGQLYYFVSDLIADSDKLPKFLQLYFYDAQYVKELCSNLSLNLNLMWLVC